MKPFWKELGFAAVMGLALPAVMLTAAVGLTLSRVTEDPQIQTSPTEPETVAQVTRTRIGVLTGEGTVEEMDLEEYLVGVVLAERPVSFEPEAQKAQAVVARTFTLRSQQGGKHETAAVCMDSGCCQAYIAPEEYLVKGGTQEGIDKMRAAVEATAGQVLTYEGELIEATYFSCSGGSTEDAVAVWGQDVPYLQSVPSPGEETASFFTDSKTVSAEDLQSALGVRLTGPVSTWFGDVTFTEGGGVDTVVIGGVAYRGTTVRTLLQLRSTAFSVSFSEDAVTFHTRGYGHRVGMSQYGANAMAAEGKTCGDILAHYYPGTELVQYSLELK